MKVDPLARKRIDLESDSRRQYRFVAIIIIE